MSNSPILSRSTASSIREAALALKAGHLVAFPTETVYGLGADARNPEAIKRIYDVKGRPADHPLIVHISSMNQLEKWATEIPEYALSLARAFWPGPLTLILKRTGMASDFITGGQGTVGVRVPSDPIALALIREFEKISNSAIAAPSANRFGHVSPTSSSDVYEELGSYLVDSDIILNGGNSKIGIESTIVDCTYAKPRILRKGIITKHSLQEVLGFELPLVIKAKPKHSGEFEKHYAPQTLVNLDGLPTKGDCFLALSHVPTPEGAIRVSSPKTVEEFAKCLYSSFRKSDKLGSHQIVVVQPDGDGLAEAIRDRLLKASKGR
jgi:L-threonylcarbamoyladenylate synthase